MAIASLGYEGTVGEAAWALYGKFFASMHGVAGPGDLAPTVSGLTVTIAPGIAFGDNIVDVVTGIENEQVQAAGSSTRYDTVVLRRNWSGTSTTPSGGVSGGVSSLEIVQGGGSPMIAAGVKNTPGTEADQLIAIVSTTAGSSNATLVADLRCHPSSAALVRSKLAMTGPVGTRYVLRDGSLEDGSRWVVSLSQAGTATVVKESEPLLPKIATGVVPGGWSTDAYGSYRISHNLGWQPMFFHAMYGFGATGLYNLLRTETIYGDGMVTPTSAKIWVTGQAGAGDLKANLTFNQPLSWLAVA